METYYLLGLFVPGFVQLGSFFFLSPLKILLQLSVLAVPQLQSVAAAQCPSELSEQPEKLHDDDWRYCHFNSHSMLKVEVSIFTPEQSSAVRKLSLTMCFLSCRCWVSNSSTQEDWIDQRESESCAGPRASQKENHFDSQQGQRTDQRWMGTR